MKILAVGLDHDYVQLLRQNDIVVDTSADEEDFDPVEWLTDELYDGLIINLDVGFGTMLCRELRKERIKTPVLAVATYDLDGAMNWSEMRSSFLENGGDDLIQIPFNPRELVASLRSVVRRVQGSTTSVLTFEVPGLHIKIDQTSSEVFINHLPLHLTGREKDVLTLLVAKKNTTITRDQIMHVLYASFSDGEVPEEKIIDVFMSKIRAKFRPVYPDIKNVLVNVWGKGYMLREDLSKKPVTELHSPSDLTYNGM